MGRSGDFFRFAFSAVVAPKIIFAQRLKIFPNRNDGRACCIKRNRLDSVAGDSGLLDGLASGGGQSAHMVFMRLGRVFRIFPLAMQWIFSNRRSQHSALAIDDRDTNTESPKIYPRNYGHQQSPPAQLSATRSNLLTLMRWKSLCMY